MRVLGGAGLLALLVVLFVVPGRVVEDPRVPGEIVLQLASIPGPNPFTPSVKRAAPPAAPPAAAPTSPPAAASASPPPTSSPSAGVEGSAGTGPGLYAGNRGTASCDATQLVVLLNGDTTRRHAFAQVEGVAGDDIAAYLKELTPVLLRQDARLTDHGYDSDHVTAFQAVLQAGTAVFVDRLGLPRVRCEDGSPLTEPQPATVTPAFVGNRWPGFDPSALVVVTAAATPVTAFVLVDTVTGARFNRPVGGDGSSDTVAS